METITLQELIKSFTLDQFLIEISSKKLYIEFIRFYPVFCSIVIFWLGCNIGSFLNVCIYRLPLGMSLLHPKSHCPKCGHKLGMMENIPIFSYLFLLGSCKECGERISPRYLIVETLTGLIFTGIYLGIYFFYQPITSLALLFFMASVFLTAAFTDCDLRIIPDTVSLPGMILIPAYWYFHNWPSLKTFDLPSLIQCLICMAGTALFFTAFHFLGKKLFKRDAFGWGDVKLVVLIAGAFFWLPTLVIVLASCIAALIYMPVFWHFFPKRRRRGFPFAPFLAVFVIGWSIFGVGLTYLVFPSTRPRPAAQQVRNKKSPTKKKPKKKTTKKGKTTDAKGTVPAADPGNGQNTTGKSDSGKAADEKGTVPAADQGNGQNQADKGDSGK